MSGEGGAQEDRTSFIGAIPVSANVNTFKMFEVCLSQLELPHRAPWTGWLNKEHKCIPHDSRGCSLR